MRVRYALALGLFTVLLAVAAYAACPPEPEESGCLARAGDTVVAGPGFLSAGRNIFPPGANHTYDFRDVIYQANPPEYPLGMRGDPVPSGTCVTGLRVNGNAQMDTMDWRYMKNPNNGFNGDNLLFKFTGAAGVIVENYWTSRSNDGVSFPGSSPGSWTLRDSYFRQIHDDVVENDGCRQGLIEDILVDSTYMFLSQRAGGSGTCTNAGPVTIKDAIVKLACITYLDLDDDENEEGSCGANQGVGHIWKVGPGNDPITVQNSIFVVPSRSVDCKSAQSQPCAQMDFPSNGTYTNVTVIWQGGGSYPGATRPGVSVSTDINIYNNARSAWLSEHGCDANANDCSFLHK